MNNNMSFTDSQLLNLVDNTIISKTDYTPDSFTGGSIQITSTNNHELTKYRVSLFFGYKENKNPITKTFQIREDLYQIWSLAIHTKIKSLNVKSNGMNYSELNELMKNTEVVSNIVDSNTVVSISRGKETSLRSRNEVVTKDNIIADIEIIITDLNRLTGKSLKANNKETVKLIKARLADGYKLENFLYVNNIKFREWNNTDQQKYIRPSTLYGDKFDMYLNTSEADIKANNRPLNRQEQNAINIAKWNKEIEESQNMQSASSPIIELQANDEMELF